MQYRLTLPKYENTILRLAYVTRNQINYGNLRTLKYLLHNL